MPAFPKKNLLTSVWLMLLGVFSFSLANVAIKDTASEYPILQIVFFRYFFTLIACALLMKRKRGWKILSTSNKRDYLLSGVLGVFGLYCLFKSFTFLPLADATAFTFSSPLLVTTFSTFFLKEPISPSQWGAILIGLGAVVVMAHPTGDISLIGALHSLGFAFTNAFLIVKARILAHSEGPSTVVFYFALSASVFSALFLPVVWTTPSGADLLKLMSLGLGSGIGQLLVTYAFRNAPARLLAPLIYSGMIWGVLFGFFFWGDRPSLTLLLGCGVLIATGLFVVAKEHRTSPSSL